jgi:hypothetical protein
VGTNLLKSIPALGGSVQFAVSGEIGASTVVRLRLAHLRLAVPAFIIIAWHFPVGGGGISRRSQPPGLPRRSRSARRLAALIATVVLFALAMLFPPSPPAAGFGRPQGRPPR